ncbi:LysE family translocator [Bordetella pseudohinzii]|uniref:Homoserine/homoserine lactone efflux protein n=1 Tax=Bordetella pseudohinzii TaxID=1331258 RepID=A0A0J6EZG0_9BORD|nr:LysE family translocator [Bordetella pseudohinzii]ANY17472.1 lysine transporter LysE [Bordetella pseudohinzii]KMM25695.1 lysine transporter LysE [Bordetella pseudohinzii]KXA81688.1 lysine transporter LysE [Bordetella pseudohinzii]KXA83073.1 lysine transporter LysE [Bordetella pseudohinzii]CUI71886.1 Homoserine/homoserine lactone efflux protein [Bordetella pseudohinzii]
MQTQVLLAYCAIAAVSVVSPGPATVLAIRNALGGGMRGVFFGALGNAAGLFCLSAASMLGLGVLLRTSAALFLAVKVLGACYLFYLGFKQLRGRASLVIADSGPLPRRANASYFREAVGLALTNPKPILFFAALFPQFVSAGEPLMPQFLVLTGIFMLMSLCSLHAYALMARQARAALTRPRVVRWVDRVMGGIFVSFGAGLLALKRIAP